MASGDSGPDSCDDSHSVPSTLQPASVNLLASTRFTVAVGGTQFNDVASPSTYWNSTNDPTTHASAKSYIPENVWNEKLYCRAMWFLADGALVQRGREKFNFLKTSVAVRCHGNSIGNRAVLDVSLAAADHDGYVLCLDASCQGSSPGFAVISGTSASAQVFGGVMALVVQKTGARVGIANFTLYKLAGTETLASCNGSSTTTAPAGACIFNDVTVGNTNIPA